MTSDAVNIFLMTFLWIKQRVRLINEINGLTLWYNDIRLNKIRSIRDVSY